MTARRIRLAAAPLLTASLLLTGCAGATFGSAGESGAGQSPLPSPVNPHEREFYLCLEKHGVVLDGDRDPLRVNKDEGVYDAETDAKAHAQCDHFLPSPEEQAARAKKEAEFLADCMYEQGVKDYPEPDPTTGEVEFGGDESTDERADPVFREAMTACQRRMDSEMNAANR